MSNELATRLQTVMKEAFRGTVTPSFAASTHLPAIVSEFSRRSVEPFLMMLHVYSPFVQG